MNELRLLKTLFNSIINKIMKWFKDKKKWVYEKMKHRSFRITGKTKRHMGISKIFYFSILKESLNKIFFLAIINRYIDNLIVC